MSLWGKNDQANNAPIWAPTSVKLAPNVANRDTLFGNNTANGYGTNETVGMFGVSEDEIASSGTAGHVYAVNVTNAGTGYTNVIVIGFSGGNGSGATATAAMRLVSVTVGHGGNNYAPGDLLRVAGGTATVNGLINVVTTEIRSAAVNAGGTGYANGDFVTILTGTGTAANAEVTTGAADTIVASVALVNNGIYTVNPTTSNVATTNSTGTGTGLTLDLVTKVLSVAISNSGLYTALPTLTNNQTVNATGVGVSANINLVVGLGAVTVTANGTGYESAPTVTISGATGSAAAASSIIWSEDSAVADKGIAHSGWVLRKQGTGGRAGRISYEVLVAGGISGDASDDSLLPD